MINCSFVSWWEQVALRWDDDRMSTLYYTNKISLIFDFYSASSMKQQSMGRHVAPLGHIIWIQGQQVFALTP